MQFNFLLTKDFLSLFSFFNVNQIFDYELPLEPIETQHLAQGNCFYLRAQEKPSFSLILPNERLSPGLE